MFCSCLYFKLKVTQILFLLVYTIIIIFLTIIGADIYITEGKTKTSENREIWKSKCPDVNDGLQRIIVTYEELHGRLGCHIWGYLSVWAVAKHYGLWPVMPQVTIDELSQYFVNLSINSLEGTGEECNIPWLEEEYISLEPVASLGQLLEKIEEAGPNLSLLKLSFLVVHTEEVLTRWRELRNQLLFKPHIVQAAFSKLQKIQVEYLQNTTFQIMNTTIPRDLEFVGVHVRRTDFLSMYADVYPNAEPPEPRFYLNAMQWMREHVQRPLVFLITSDDLTWCQDNLNKSSDIIIAGNISTPGEDLALLGLCNHTILAHGTYGLSAAMFARGRYTLVYDPRQNINTKEMEFVPYLPGWHALDNDGKSHYRPGQQNFKMPYREGNTTNGFWYTY